MYDVRVKILCPTQQVIFCDILGSWLTQVLDQMWMAASLAEAEKKYKNVCVIGYVDLSDHEAGIAEIVGYTYQIQHHL